MTDKDKKPNFRRTKYACYFAYLAMSSVFSLPPLLLATFHEMYDISYTLLGTLILVNFCTQLTIDLIFTFFSRFFNVRLIVRTMPVVTSAGLMIYALVPHFAPEHAALGLIVGTVIFSVASGLSEVLISPTVAALPSDHPERDMSTLHSLYGWGVVSVVLISSLYFILFGTENWVYLALFWAFLPLVAALVFSLSPMPDMDVSSEGGSRDPAGRRMGILLCVLCIFLGSAAENTMTGWISSFMENALLIPKAVGDILGMAMFAILLAVGRNLYARFGKDISRTILWGFVGATACYLIAGGLNNVPLSFIACVLVGLCTSMLWPGTLIMMDEKIPGVGVAAYALMAAGGDFGASVAPQLLGIIVDKISVSAYAARVASETGMAAEQIGLKTGMLIAAVFPALGVLLLIGMRRYFARRAKAPAEASPEEMAENAPDDSHTGA